VAPEPSNEALQTEELAELLRAIRERVNARYPEALNGVAPQAIADLMPLVHARDAAEAKVAAIGSVNPRPPGPLNWLIQMVKRSVSRGLNWFVRDQVTFNREVMACVEASVEALNQCNRALAGLHGFAREQAEFGRALKAGLEDGARHQAQFSRAMMARLQSTLEAFERMKDELAAAVGLRGEFQDMRTHWIAWRAEWEQRLATNEIQFLRSVADLQGAFQHRSTLMESNFREMLKSQHADYLGALDRSTLEIQKKLWTDLDRIRTKYEALIHSELRVVRQRAGVLAQAGPSPAAPAPAAADAGPAFDYGRFAERFRGSEEYVKSGQGFYVPHFSECKEVLDIGCGRGEFLDLMREAGIPARGIDLSRESVDLCRSKGLQAEVADLFPYLDGLADASLDGIFTAQVVEHLSPARLPDMIRLAAQKLRRGGVIAIETPNRECLAIFATHFYLDPTHSRPVPHPLLAFYLEESGIGHLEVHHRSPAIGTMPALAALPDDFRNAFFGGLDYAIIGRKLI
jgi:2-polyprenyl-3-methyl-5-hydroxy-6-metoxy-1,4-benzoquinol methylase